MSIRLDTVIVRADQPLCSPVGSGLVLFSLANSKYYALDEVTTAIWRRLVTPVDVRALCLALQHEFDVPPAQCEADVIELLEDLRARGLVSVVAAAPPSSAPTRQ